jgi:hypothetical protein
MGRTRGFLNSIGLECPSLRMSPGLPKVFVFCFRQEGGPICPPTKDFLCQAATGPFPLPPSL